MLVYDPDEVAYPGLRNYTAKSAVLLFREIATYSPSPLNKRSLKYFIFDKKCHCWRSVYQNETILKFP